MIAEVDPEAVHAYECHISDTRLLHVCARSDMPPQQLQALVNLMVQPRPQASCWWLLLDAFTTHPDALTAAYLARDMSSVNKVSGTAFGSSATCTCLAPVECTGSPV